jgi:hypothetical protein
MMSSKMGHGGGKASQGVSKPGMSGFAAGD